MECFQFCFSFNTFLIFSDGYCLSSNECRRKSGTYSNRFFSLRLPHLRSIFWVSCVGSFNFIERGTVDHNYPVRPAFQVSVQDLEGCAYIISLVKHCSKLWYDRIRSMNILCSTVSSPFIWSLCQLSEHVENSCLVAFQVTLLNTPLWWQGPELCYYTF